MHTPDAEKAIELSRDFKEKVMRPILRVSEFTYICYQHIRVDNSSLSHMHILSTFNYARFSLSVAIGNWQPN